MTTYTFYIRDDGWKVYSEFQRMSRTEMEESALAISAEQGKPVMVMRERLGGLGLLEYEVNANATEVN
jgi:hypothetical protein